MSEENKVNYWSGIWALALGVSGIMIGEFLPAGLLTPMAKDLNITEGVAGQTVTVTSIIAVFASLGSAYFTQKFDRKNVLIGFSLCTIISSLMVAVFYSYSLILVGRVILGITLGGFWSMATAIAIRLVEDKNVPKALSIIFGSASFSAMLAAPMGSFLGDLIGWRNTFYFNAAIGCLSVLFILFSMPKLPPTGVVKLSTMFEVLKIPSVKSGLLAIGFAFCGRFSSTTYLRPYSP